MNAVTNFSSIIANEFRRSLATMFPGYFPDTKHKHYRDFSWPTDITNQMLMDAYKRNGIAKAAVTKTRRKCWETFPQISENDNPDETTLEELIRQWADDVGLWRVITEADKRAMIGRYSGFILRIADGQNFDQPVERTTLENIVELVPFWSTQMRVAEWESDLNSDNYGKPRMYEFNEANVKREPNGTERQVKVHPDRVFVWSEDGTTEGESLLEAGYNALIDLEKISGAGGEGFWKNAKSAPVLNIDKEARLKDMAKAMGVPEDEIADAMDEQVKDWQKGFDAMLMLQGIEATTLSVNLPNPEHFFANPLMTFAASVDIPVKILVGNITGERASSEDVKQWNATCASRRQEVCIPRLNDFIKKLERFKALPEKDWQLIWGDLTESTMEQKVDTASKMAEINAKMRGADGVLTDIVFTPDEIRGAVDYEPLDMSQIVLDEEGEEDDTDVTPPEPDEEPEEE